MKMSLRTKLSLSFILASVVLFSGLGIISNNLLEHRFKDYTIKNQTQKNDSIVAQLMTAYDANSGEWDSGAVGNIGVSALSDGLMVKVYAKDGSVIWDARTHNEGYCTSMLSRFDMNMRMQDPNFNGGYIAQSRTLELDSKKVGSVDMGYYGPYYYSDNDISFIRDLNRMLFGAALFSMILSIGFGAYMAKHLSDPIKRVISVSSRIAKGSYKDRVDEDSSTKEIVELAGAINSLSQSLEDQEELRRRLTTDVAHELRTPITALKSHVELMIDGIWEPTHDRLKSCYDEIDRISSMISDIGRLSKIESDNLVLNIEVVEMKSLVQGVVRGLEGQFHKSGVGVEVYGDEARVNADGDKLCQVFSNLLSNALKYTDSGGRVSIGVSNSPESVMVTVKDTGIGIPESDLPHIFERFYRVDKSRTRMSGGSGIGLAIVKSLVEAHGGRVEVSSVEGKGSEFVVYLPRKAGSKA
jgi:two-component system, OmpR family, sensor histidine kinase BaeS